MATGTETLTLALRNLGRLAFDQSPDATDQAIGLLVLIDLLDRLVEGYCERLYDQDATASLTIGGNTRLRFTGASGQTVTLPATPNDGWRAMIVNASANSLAVDRNGRLIDASASNGSVASGATFDRFYRADLGGWISPTITALSDTLPYPKAYDDGLAAMATIMLAAKYALNDQVDPLTGALAKATQEALLARYGARRFPQAA